MVARLRAGSKPCQAPAGTGQPPVGAVAARVSGLVKKYRDVVAVAGVDFEIKRGEIFALLGPNGAGKTTVVEILEGHRDRDAGLVEVLGADPASAPRQWYDRIGIVLQHTADAPDLTPREVLRHYSSYYTRGRDADELVQATGLAECAERRIYQLSGGQRRRLDVALGIVGQPDLLFLDEPTTGFDPEARRGFWALVRRLATEGTSILLTTHYLEEAEALADRVAVLLHGRIAISGEPGTLAGRTSAEACVSWLEGAARRTVRTPRPEAVITELMGRFDVIPELTVTRPTLEDVYLELVRSSSGQDDEV